MQQSLREVFRTLVIFSVALLLLFFRSVYVRVECIPNST